MVRTSPQPTFPSRSPDGFYSRSGRMRINEISNRSVFRSGAEALDDIGSKRHYCDIATLIRETAVNPINAGRVPVSKPSVVCNRHPKNRAILRNSSAYFFYELFKCERANCSIVPCIVSHSFVERFFRVKLCPSRRSVNHLWMKNFLLLPPFAHIRRRFFFGPNPTCAALGSSPNVVAWTADVLASLPGRKFFQRLVLMAPHTCLVHLVLHNSVRRKSCIARISCNVKERHRALARSAIPPRPEGRGFSRRLR